jgi:hypothetical protein
MKKEVHMSRAKRGHLIVQSQIRVNERIAGLTNGLIDRVIGVRTVGDAILCAIDFLWSCDRRTSDVPGIHPLPRLPDMINGFPAEGSAWMSFHPATPGAFRRIEATGDVFEIDIGPVRTTHVTKLSYKFAMTPKDVYLLAISIAESALIAERLKLDVSLKRDAKGALAPFETPKRTLRPTRSSRVTRAA